MPAISGKQQRLMHAALQAKLKGTDDPRLKKIAASMSEKDLRGFAARVETPKERKGRMVKSEALKRARGK